MCLFVCVFVCAFCVIVVEENKDKGLVAAEGSKQLGLDKPERNVLVGRT